LISGARCGLRDSDDLYGDMVRMEWKGVVVIVVVVVGEVLLIDLGIRSEMTWLIKHD
jgi:hypothetical protein